MDNLELRTLRLLEVLEGNQILSQRELARKLDVSLGLVNSFVRRLAQKGYFKITTIPKNRVKYILTPKGLAEKSKLTYEYINYSLHFYKNARLKLKRNFQSLQEKGVKKVIFYGIGHFAEIAYISLKETEIELNGIIAESDVGSQFMGFGIDSPKNISCYSYDRAIYTADLIPDNIDRIMTNHGIPIDKIVIPV